MLARDWNEDGLGGFGPDRHKQAPEIKISAPLRSARVSAPSLSCFIPKNSM